MPTQLRELLAHCTGVTHVLHLAAQAGVRYAVKNPAAYAPPRSHLSRSAPR